MNDDEIKEAVLTLLAISPGIPWFAVTRSVTRMHPVLTGRQGKRDVNRVIGLMIAHGKIHQNGSSLRLTKVKEDRA